MTMKATPARPRHCVSNAERSFCFSSIKAILNIERAFLANAHQSLRFNRKQVLTEKLIQARDADVLQ